MRVTLDELKGEIDFAILTIREDECNAVLDRFKPDRYAEGQRRYEAGELTSAGGRKLSFVVARGVKQGNGEAQRLADFLIQDIDPSILVLVGIGGAVPSTDYTLGDVVCPTHVHDFSVRAVAEGGRDTFNVGGGEMHHSILSLLGSLPQILRNLPEWNTPAAIGREAPRVEVPKPTMTSRVYGSRKWRTAVCESLARHFSDGRPVRNPIATARAVASSDALVKDTATLSTWLTDARSLGAVEMELAGVYLAARKPHKEYPVLAMRGISDVVGFRRDEAWTAYACHTAASFAHALFRSGAADELVGPPVGRTPPASGGTGGAPSGPDLTGEAGPAMAPRDLPHFAGRAGEMKLLEDRLLQPSGADAATCSLVGVGGVGKSALAAHFARVHRSRFPGGVFWAYVDRQTPGNFARCIAIALGRPHEADAQYDGLQARSAIQRLLAGRRALLILDNADGEAAPDHVSNMLPAERSVSVLITTRNKTLSGLFGAGMVELDGFGPEEGLALFKAVLPAHDARWSDGTGDVREMIQDLGGLPLATDITAQYLARRLDIPFRDHCAYLRRPGSVSHLSSGHARVADIVVEKSLGLLTPQQEAAFFALGACAESGFSTETARAVAGPAGEHRIEDVLDRLNALSLLQVHCPGRYRLHPVVRACVRGRATSTEADRRHLGRWCEYVARYARDLSADWDPLTREWDGIGTAWDWCLGEVDKLADQAPLAPDGEFVCQSAVTIADSLRYFLDGRGYWPETLARMPTCIRAAVRVRNSEAEFRIRRHFALLLRKSGRYEDAEQENQRNIEHARRVGRLDWRGMELEQLGRVRVRQERYEEAKRLYHEALAIAESSPAGEKYVRQCLNCLGELALRQRQPKRAISDFQRAYSLYVRAGDTQGIGATLAHLGDALLELGEADRALAHYVEAVRVFTSPGKVDLDASNFLRLGAVLERRGERVLALACYVLSAAMCERLAITELRGRRPGTERDRLLAELGPEGDSLRASSSRRPEDVVQSAHQAVLQFVASRPALAESEPAYQHPPQHLPSVGFIGLGRMGRPLAERLLRGGCRLTFTNRHQSVIDDMRALGALYVESPADVARMSEVIFTMLRADPDVRDVILGDNGVLAGARPGQLVIDMTTIHPDTVKHVAEVAGGRGVVVVDAPVNGDVGDARDGKVTILVGGDRDAFQRARPLLQTMAAKALHMGPLGTGQTAKLCHQLLAGGIMALYNTVLTLGRAAGADPGTLAEVIEPFSAAAMLHERLRTLMERVRFPPEALVVDVMVRDMTAASALADQLHVHAPVLETIRQVYQHAASQGRGGDDFSSLPTQ